MARKPSGPRAALIAGSSSGGGTMKAAAALLCVTIWNGAAGMFRWNIDAETEVVPDAPNIERRVGTRAVAGAAGRGGSGGGGAAAAGGGGGAWPTAFSDTELRPFLLIGPMGVCVSAWAGAAGQVWGRPRRADGRQGFDCLVAAGVPAFGILAISRSTIAIGPAARPEGLDERGRCLNWWAIIFSTAAPSGNGTRPVRQ